MSSSKYNEFLQTYKTSDNEKITHTRMGDRDKVYPGKYSIPSDTLDEFYRLYCDYIVIKPEYLTEKQLENGPLFIDLDFRYDIGVKKRLHNSTHIVDIIQIYLNNLGEITETENTSFNIYVLEKDHIVETDTLVKDGIHLQLCINLDRPLHKMIRNRVLNEIGDVLEKLPLTNSYNDVLDEGISKGTTNWQLFGSQKPNNIKYKITHCYSVNFDEYNDWTLENEMVLETITPELVRALSIRNTRNPVVAVRDTYLTEYQTFLNQNKRKKEIKKNTNNKLNNIIIGGRIDYTQITNQEELDDCIERSLNSIKVENYMQKEIYLWLMALPSDYYNDFNKWIRTGWVCKNESISPQNFGDDMFLYWIKFSSQSPKFSFSDIPERYEDWHTKWLDENILKDYQTLTFRSLIFWVKISSFEKFKDIQKQSIDYHIEETLSSGTEWELATVLNQLYKGFYVCTDIGKGQWFEYKQHRWVETDCAHTLRMNMSNKLAPIYKDKMFYWTRELNEATDDKVKEKIQAKIKQYIAISNKLKNHTSKNNIMKEAATIFYDEDFFKNLNENPYLLGCKNGVYDFKEKCFRDGRPDDYITLSTNNNYIKFDDNNPIHIRMKREINTFMSQLMPDSNLRKYMWQHLASSLLGTIENQTFNIYLGGGRNGKSKLVEFMGMTLGMYKGTIPTTLITQKRTTIGSASPEIAQLCGCRYAVMNELSKGDAINEGIMKEITGGDPLQGRSLFKNTITFKPQFKLVVCTNNLPEIRSNDEGTWRRIRVCDFVSKFVEEFEPNVDNQFTQNKDINTKFKEWKGVFLSLLVEIAQETMGNVTDCSLVLSAAKTYRKSQDHLSEFVDEKITKEIGSYIKQTDVFEEFKIWWSNNKGGKHPPGKELFDYLNNKIGTNRNRSWVNYKIIYDDNIESEEEKNKEND
mgnify:CR=1 FL=1|jgi:P4 family phage/plasmid primase-like protien